MGAVTVDAAYFISSEPPNVVGTAACLIAYDGATIFTSALYCVPKKVNVESRHWHVPEQIFTAAQGRWELGGKCIDTEK